MPDLEQLFSLCGLVAMVGWVLLVVVPHYRTPRIVAGVVIPLLLAMVYLVLIVTNFFGAEGGFTSLRDVARLFDEPALLLAGWVHYLAFDLFIGAWETRDARVAGVPHFMVVPCLVLTFMLGPIGLLAYMALRAWRAHSLDLARS